MAIILNEQRQQKAWDEMRKSADEWSKIKYQERYQKKLQQEQFKQQRILSAKENKRVHALKVIIEHIKPNYPKQKNISINYHHFNYENKMDDSKLLEYFLEQAKKEGCFKSFARMNYAGGTEFSFGQINLNRIKKYRDKLQRKENDAPQSNNKSKPICKLPKNTKWENIKIQFIDEKKLKFYCNKNLIKQIDNSLDKIFAKRELEFLRQLAMIQNYNKSIKREDGTISGGCSEFHPNKANIASALKYSENNCETIKSRLAKKLKKLFIDSDPFYPYSRKECYETIFKLEPETTLKNKGNIYMTKARYTNTEDLEAKMSQDNNLKNKAQRSASNKP